MCERGTQKWKVDRGEMLDSRGASRGFLGRSTAFSINWFPQHLTYHVQMPYLRYTLLPSQILKTFSVMDSSYFILQVPRILARLIWLIQCEQ